VTAVHWLELAILAAVALTGVLGALGVFQKAGRGGHAPHRTSRQDRAVADDRRAAWMYRLNRPVLRPRATMQAQQAVLTMVLDSADGVYDPCPSCGGGPSDLHGKCEPTGILNAPWVLTEQQLAKFKLDFLAAVAETPMPPAPEWNVTPGDYLDGREDEDDTDLPREPWLPAPLPVTTEPPLAPLPSTAPGLPRPCPDVTATQDACDTVVGMKAIPGRTVLKEHVAKTMHHTRSALGSWVDDVLASDVPLVDQELGLMAARNERWAEAQHG
jgi:hypothetical protein